jgi:hypothetical protein
MRDGGERYGWANRYVWSCLPAPVEGDFACQVLGRVLTGGDHGWAIGLSTPGDGRSVAIRLRRDGAVEVGDLFWGSPIKPPRPMVGPIQPAEVRSGDKFNTLLVILRGGQTLEIYLNGTAISPPIQLEQPLAQVHPGMMFWVRDPTLKEKGHAEFSRFTLWQLPPAQAKP